MWQGGNSTIFSFQINRIKTKQLIAMAQQFEKVLDACNSNAKGISQLNTMLWKISWKFYYKEKQGIALNKFDKFDGYYLNYIDWGGASIHNDKPKWCCGKR